MSRLISFVIALSSGEAHEESGNYKMKNVAQSGTPAYYCPLTGLAFLPTLPRNHFIVNIL